MNGRPEFRVEGDELVMRASVHTLKFAAENCTMARHGLMGYDYRFAVHDPHEFARALARELNDENHEDGSTEIERLLDRMFEKTAESGTDSCDFFDLND